jgi:hypothetical protein
MDKEEGMRRNEFNEEDVARAMGLVGTVEVDKEGNKWQHPIAWSYGGGKDSSAGILHMYELGIRPDLIIIADVGGEHPHTWKTVAAMDEWCRAHDFPEITVTSYYSPTTRYQSLEGNCLHNDGLPSLAYGGHSCSLKWKIEAIEDEIWGIEGWEPARSALEQGIRVTRCIGYDYGCADSKRFAKVDKQEKAELEKGKFLHWKNRYPLREWKLSRFDLDDTINAHPDFVDMLEKHTGSRTVRKSSCFFCPAMKVEEVEEMARDYPNLAMRAAVMEYRAETGKHGLITCNGLGLGTGPKHSWDRVKGRKNWSWSKHLVSVGLLPSDWLEVAKAKGLVPLEWDSYSVEAKAMRDMVLQCREQEKAAAEKLPEKQRSVVLAKGTKEEVKKQVEKQVAKTTTGKAWIATRVTTKKAEKAKKELLAPDWANVSQPKPTKEVKSARREAKKRFRAAISRAQALCAVRGD